MRLFLLLAVAGGTAALAADPTVSDLKTSAPTTERFDLAVREGMFNGFSGDEPALARGLKRCEETLAKNPKHAEALVWRGAARVYQSSLRFGKKEFAAGMTL